MERLLTAADAARILGVVPARVRQLAVQGHLVPMDVTEGGTRLFRRADVEHLAATREAKRTHMTARMATSRADGNPTGEEARER